MTSYAADALGPAERIRYAAKRSLWGYALYFMLGAGLLFAAVTLPRMGVWIAVPLVAAAAVVLWPFLARSSTELVITDQRVIAKSGLVSRTSVEMRLEKIESVRISEGLLGRILGYGDVVLTGTGATHDPIVGIAKPLKFRAELNAAIEAGKGAAG